MASKRKAGEQSQDFSLVRQFEALQDHLVVLKNDKKRMQDELSLEQREKADAVSKVSTKEQEITQLQEQLRACQEDLRACQEDLRACQEDLTRPDKELLTLLARGGVVLRVDKVTAQAASAYFRLERFGVDDKNAYDFTAYNQRAVGFVILLMVQQKKTRFAFPEDLGENEIVVEDMVKMIDYIQLFEEQQVQGESRYAIKKVLNAALCTKKMGVLLEINNLCAWLYRECQGDDHEVRWVESMYSHAGTAISEKIKTRTLIPGAPASYLTDMDGQTISKMATLLAAGCVAGDDDGLETGRLQSPQRDPRDRYWEPMSPTWSPPDTPAWSPPPYIPTDQD